jgi:hypothetical protein
MKSLDGSKDGLVLQQRATQFAMLAFASLRGSWFPSTVTGV